MYESISFTLLSDRAQNGHSSPLLMCESNANSVDLWKRYVGMDAVAAPAEARYRSVVARFRDEMVKLLDVKGASPLEAITLSVEYNSALDAVTNLYAELTIYNEAIRVARAQIEAFRRSARSPGRLQSATNELRWLELTKKRFEAGPAAACAQYVVMNREKEELDQQKAQTRVRLDTYSNAVVSRYRTSINKYLKRFQAGFSIEEVRVEYSGRVPNSTICVRINETTVEMGSAETPLSEPSFRNTLSAGDRSTLALAFFLTELEEDANKANCVVVFDDPFNSQDHFRRTRTITEIRRCGDSVAQIIVMSHDRNFLRDLWKLPLPSADRKSLWLIKAGSKDSVLAEWPIETDTETEDASNRRVLLRFHIHDEGRPRDVVQKLRPVLETHMRRMAPHVLGGVTGLGSMLEKIRDAGSPPLLVDLYDDIDAVNIYTRKYMHGEGPDPDNEPISETELKGFVEQVLDIAGPLADG